MYITSNKINIYLVNLPTLAHGNSKSEIRKETWMKKASNEERKWKEVKRGYNVTVAHAVTCTHSNG